MKPSLIIPFLAMALASSADAQFISLSGPYTGSDSIRIGDLDGAYTEPLDGIPGLPIDTDSENFVVYSRVSAGSNSDEIMASDLLAGNTQVLVTGVSFRIYEFSVDESAGVVFSNRYTSSNPKDIVKHDLATGTYQVLHNTQRVDAIALDPVSQNVYWLEADTNWTQFALWRCAYDGSSLTQLNVFTRIGSSMADLKYISDTQQLLVSDAGQGSPALLNLSGLVVQQTTVAADPNRYIGAVNYDPFQDFLYWEEHSTGGAPHIYRQRLSGSASPELLAVLNNSSPMKNRLLVFPDFDGDELGTYREALWGTADDDLDSDDDGLADADEYTESRSQVWFPAPSGAETHYYALSAATDYHTAADEARRFGGYLASVGDAAENDAIGDGIRWAPNFHRGPAFMGLHRPTGAAPWTWDSGEPLTYYGTSHPPQPQDRYAHWDTYLSTNHTWFFTDSPTGQAVIESPWEPVLSPANADSDGDGLQDGMERGLTTGIAGQPAQGILGTDLQVFQPDADPQTTTSPLDADADEDGLLDGVEDANGNGAVDAGELDPLLQDTDGDLIQDGTERGLTTRHAHTHPGDFQPDRDPLTTTDPLDPDTDGGGLRDGLEDLDGDGALVFWEFDPLSAADDRFDLLSPGLVSGQSATLTLSGHRAGSKLLVLASFTGAGEIQVFPNLYLDLLPPHHATPTVLSYSTTTTIPVSVPAAVPPGTSIWLQAVEEVADLGAYRTSDLVSEVVQ